MDKWAVECSEYECIRFTTNRFIARRLFADFIVGARMLDVAP